jgi:hypothetical protein
MKLKIFSLVLTFTNVYFFYACQPVLADGSSVKSCVSLFDNIQLPDLTKDHEEKVYAVHITEFLPINNTVKIVTKDRGRFIPTLHFSLGEPVIDHLFGKWSTKPYAIVTPLKSLRNQVLNLYPQDTYILGDFKIPKDAVLFIPRGESPPPGLVCRIIQYDKALGVKSAVSQFLHDSGSIEFKGVPNGNGVKAVKVGKIDLLKNRNLNKFFAQLFKDKPYLTAVLHSDTEWGRADQRVIEYLSSWISGSGLPKNLETDLTLAIYSLRDNILQMNQIVSQMDLPDHALKSYKEGLKDLESYINILEAESYLRKRGHSLLALKPNDPFFSKILSQRYDKQKIFELIAEVEAQLPKPVELSKSTPADYRYYLQNISMEEFVRILGENFPHPDEQTSYNIHSAISKRVFSFLMNGKITAEQAFPYFRLNAEPLRIMALTEVFSNNLLYRVAEANDMNGKKYKDTSNREVLRFLKNPWINQYLESKEFLRFSPDAKKRYLEKINSVDDIKVEGLTDFSVIGNAYGLKGNLISVGKTGDGFTKGVWHLDENNVLWFIKKDANYNELQTSAEVISSNIYRFFGYDTPETVKLIKNGVHYAAVKNAGEYNGETDFININTTEIRQMRVVAAYLKDWDRLGNPNNNLLKPDGTITLLDFGGTLGARARGTHKPGPIFSNAIGSFEATQDINVIFGAYNVQAKEKHPWNNLTQNDIYKIVAKFRQLTDPKIESIVDKAGYSNPADRNYMIQALKTRRNGIIRQLLNFFQSDSDN